MDKTLSPEMQQQIRTYCDSVCAMHGLDDVREELQDHFEDKMIAYLSCSEKLQEQDAFLLVREHFGDPAVLKSMFQTVHVKEAGVTLGRRVCSAFAAAFLIMALSHAAMTVCDLLTTAWGAVSGPQWATGLFFNTYRILISILSPVAFYLILRYWNRRIDAGLPVWFLRMPFAISLLVSAGLLIASRFVPQVLWMSSSVLPFGKGLLPIAIMMVPGILGYAATGVLWMWWIDRAPRARASMFVALVCWLGSSWFFAGPASILPSLNILVVDNNDALSLGGLSLTLFTSPSGQLSYILRLAMPAIMHMGYVLANWYTLYFYLTAAVLALIVHSVIRRSTGLRTTVQ